MLIRFPASGRIFFRFPLALPGRIYGTIHAFTVKAYMKAKKTPDRISEIVAEMHSITEFAGLADLLAGEGSVVEAR